MLIGGGIGRPSAASSYSLATNFFDFKYGITNITYSEANMRALWGSAAGNITAIAIVPKSVASLNKWVCEIEVVAANSTFVLGIADYTNLGASSARPENTAYGWGYFSNGNKGTNSTPEAYGATFTIGDKVSILIDASGATVSLSFAKNGTDQGVAYSGISGSFVPYVTTAGATDLDVRIATTLTYAFSGYTQWR